MEADETFLSLATLLKRKNNIYWHITYLQKYLAENIIPFGLRLKLFPHFINPTVKFKNKWEDRLTKCSLELISLLFEEHRGKIGLIDNDLIQINTTLVTLSNTPGFNEKQKQLNENLAKSSKDSITTKEKKLIQDRKAFQTNRAYIWYRFLKHKDDLL